MGTSGTDRPGSREVLGANAGIALMVLTSGAFFPILEILLRSWDAISITAARQAIGTGALLVVLTLHERRSPFPSGLPWRRLLVLSVVGIVVGSTLTTLAVLTSSGASAAIVSATHPISAAVTARLLYRVPLARGILIGTALSTFGGLVAIFGSGGTLSGFRGGELLMIASNVCWAWYSMAAQRWLAGYSQLQIATLTLVPAAIILVAIALLMSATGIVETRIDLSATSLGLILYAGCIVIGLGNLFWHYGVSRIGVPVAAMYMNLMPMAAVLFTLWIGVQPTPAQLIGGAIILAGVVYAQLQGLRRARRRSG